VGTLTPTNQRELLTVNEAAALLRLHPMTVRSMIREGRLPALQLGGKGASVRIPVDELEAWLDDAPEAA
jgi:excisionase family DNA binding protein